MNEKLTPTMKAQLLGYCEDIKTMGGYYGNKKQFWARHEKLVKWIEAHEAKR